MTWPWARPAPAPPVETRQEGGAGFTDAITRALIAQATGGAVKDADSTAALEAAAGLYSRAFALAEVTPATPATRALTPALLALAARDLIRRGEFVWLIAVDPDGAVRLHPAGSWDVRGGWDRETWRYRADLFGPSGNVTRFVPAGAVVHGQYAIDPARPWYGISPLGWAVQTGRLHGQIEAALADEAGGPRGHVVPVPQSPPTDAEGAHADDDPLAPLQEDIEALRGSTALVETTSTGWGEGTTAGSPTSDWKPQRIGANPPAALATIRSDSGAAILAACGVPADLTAPADATGRREAWRVFYHGAILPLAEMVAAELADKLDTPDLALRFDRLAAADVQGRARAYRAMTGNGTGPGIPDADARRLAGLN